MERALIMEHDLFERATGDRIRTLVLFASDGLYWDDFKEKNLQQILLKQDHHWSPQEYADVARSDALLS